MRGWYFLGFMMLGACYREVTPRYLDGTHWVSDCRVEKGMHIQEALRFTRYELHWEISAWEHQCEGKPSVEIHHDLSYMMGAKGGDVTVDSSITGKEEKETSLYGLQLQTQELEYKRDGRDTCFCPKSLASWKLSTVSELEPCDMLYTGPRQRFSVIYNDKRYQGGAGYLSGDHVDVNEGKPEDFKLKKVKHPTAKEFPVFRFYGVLMVYDAEEGESLRLSKKFGDTFPTHVHLSDTVYKKM
jgi:hypothetical protein